MLVDRILFPVTALGPGKRMVIWTMGCKKRCKMCANPELRSFDYRKDIPLSTVWQMLDSICTEKIDGFTISGGEPLCQAEELVELMKFMHTITKDILLFTGYTLEEIYKGKNIFMKQCVERATVVVAGEYIHELNDNTTPLVASTNQIFLCNDARYKNRYADYMKKGREIQNFFYQDNMLSVGIHNKTKIAN